MELGSLMDEVERLLALRPFVTPTENILCFVLTALVENIYHCCVDKQLTGKISSMCAICFWLYWSCKSRGEERVGVAKLNLGMPSHTHRWWWRIFKFFIYLFFLLFFFFKPSQFIPLTFKTPTQIKILLFFLLFLDNIYFYMMYLYL